MDENFELLENKEAWNQRAAPHYWFIDQPKEYPCFAVFIAPYKPFRNYLLDKPTLFNEVVMLLYIFLHFVGWQPVLRLLFGIVVLQYSLILFSHVLRLALLR